MKKKILAVFLSLCMAMSLLPVTALAAEESPDTVGTSQQTETSVASVKLDGGTVTYYDSFEEAFQNATSGSTIQLVKDTSTGERFDINSAKSIVLDLNGKTITSTITNQFMNLNNAGAELTITDTSGSNSGKIVLTQAGIGFCVFRGTLNIEKGTVESQGHWTSGDSEFGQQVVYLFGGNNSTDTNYTNFTLGSDAKITSVAKLQDGTEVGSGYAVTVIHRSSAFKGEGDVAYGVNVDIHGSTENAILYVNGTIKATEGNVPNLILHDGATIDGGIYAAGYANWVINGATVTGGTGMEIRAGILTVNDDSIITGTSTPTDVEPNGNGSTTDGAGIAVAQHTTRLPINVTINGGAISGYSAFYQSNPQDNDADSIAKVAVKINGGNFTSINGGTCVVYSENKTGFIAGGTFSEDPSKDTNYLATGYAATLQDGKYVVSPKTDGMEAATESEGTASSGSIGGTFTPNQKPPEEAGENEGTVDTTETDVELSVTTGNDGAANTTIKETTVTIEPATLTSVKDAGTDKVTSVSIATDVGTIKLDKQAWDTITENATTGDTTAQVTLSIKDVTKASESNTATYEITATANGKAVFAEDSATTGGEVTITVPAPKDVTGTVYVYYLGEKGAELVDTPTADNGNVSWTVEHFSTYYLTGAEQVASITKNGVTTSYGTLSEAVTAAQNGDTITLLANITNDNVGTIDDDADTVLTIDKSITIKGNGNEISIDLSIPDTFEDRDQIFSIGQTKESKVEVTLDGVTMTIKGNTAGKGDAFDVWGMLNITNGSNITVEKAQSAFTMQGGENAKVNIEKSTVTANDINGNFSNGGEWAIKDGSTVNIKDCGTHGLSVEKLTVDNSNVTVDGAKWVGIYASEMFFTNGAKVNVTNCATADGIGETYKNKGAVQLKHVAGKTPKLTIDDSTLTLKDNGNAANGQQVIYVGEGTLNNTGTINADKVDMAGAAEFNITLVNNGDKSFAVTTSKSYTLPDYPNQGNNHFQGWRDQDGKTYEGGAKVENITKDMTFTAVWNYIPPANPNYRIDIPDFEGGTVTADPAAAKAGATVTLTATPDEGYAVGTITVTDRFGDAVKVTENADGTYTFTMPNGQVTVKATFVETEEPAPAEPFPDVDENDWFYDEVVYVYENGLMNGVENNQFAPNTATNRAMLATILYRLAGEPAVSGDLPFTDVESGTWYTDAVLWAAQNGIVNGLGENTFAPMNTLTREQLVTMLYRYAEAEGYDVSAAADLSGYPDADKVQTYAQEAMSWAVAEGIVEGMDGNLNPAGSATRAQIATILMRFCEGVAK